MEQALMAVCKDIRLGKILIQTNHDTGEPEVGRPLHMCRCFYIHLTKQKKKPASDTHHPDNWWKASFYFPVPPPCVASGRFYNLAFISGCSFQTDPLINCRLDCFFWGIGFWFCCDVRPCLGSCSSTTSVCPKTSARTTSS